MSTPTPTSTPTPPPLPLYKQTFLHTILHANILTFGTYTLKSGRISPYFFNFGTFSSARLLTSLSSAYAASIHAHPVLGCGGAGFDVIFGPAYKGIPLAALTATGLFALDERYGDVGYAFNRKEAKSHGEGGAIVGMPLAGKRVLVVDDVITAGTAIREAVGIIEAAGGTVVGVVVALDRDEVLVEGGRESAVMSVRRELGVEVVPILTLGELIVGVGGEEERSAMRAYRERYGAGV